MSPQSAAHSTKESIQVKQPITGDVFDRIQQSYDSIARRAFELFENNGKSFGRDLENWFRAESELLRPLQLEMTESDDTLNIKVEVPGFNTKELEIYIEPRKLTLVGKHEYREENKKAKTIYSERCSNEIMRVLDLPAQVDSSKASATLKDGILSIELPKAAQAKTVRIEAKAASA